jgi:hypothetical protein
VAAANPYTISRPVRYGTDPEFDHAVRFAVDKRDNALMPVLSASNNYVRTVSNDPDDFSQWDEALESAGVQVLSQMPGSIALQARAAYTRSALRPASRGLGRDRWR